MRNFYVLKHKTISRRSIYNERRKGANSDTKRSKQKKREQEKEEEEEEVEKLSE